MTLGRAYPIADAAPADAADWNGNTLGPSVPRTWSSTLLDQLGVLDGEEDRFALLQDQLRRRVTRECRSEVDQRAVLGNVGLPRRSILVILLLGPVGPMLLEHADVLP